MKDRIEETIEELSKPVSCEDGISHYIDESNKRYLANQISQLFSQPLTDEVLEQKLFEIIDGANFKDGHTSTEATAQALTLLQQHYHPSIEAQKLQIELARKLGIKQAIDNLKMHHCIVDVEARIKEIEEGE